MTTETRMTLSEATAHPERCSDEQLLELSAYVAQRLDKAMADAVTATKSRPSYAPKGRPTRTEMGTQALVADQQKRVDRVAAVMAQRGL